MWVTIQDVIDAAEKNGLEWIKGDYLRFNDDGVAQAGCAIGQMAYNLECNPSDLHGVLNNLHYSLPIGSGIVAENDSNAGSYDEVVKFIHTALDEYKDKKIVLRKVKYHK